MHGVNTCHCVITNLQNPKDVSHHQSYQPEVSKAPTSSDWVVVWKEFRVYQCCYSLFLLPGRWAGVEKKRGERVCICPFLFFILRLTIYSSRPAYSLHPSSKPSYCHFTKGFIRENGPVSFPSLVRQYFMSKIYAFSGPCSVLIFLPHDHLSPAWLCFVLSSRLCNI